MTIRTRFTLYVAAMAMFPAAGFGQTPDPQDDVI